MYVSAEIIATLSSFITLGIGIFALAAWMVRRIDRLENKVDALEDKLGARIDALAGEVTEVKIAVARLEGPPRHLLPVR
ncbi:hypothetical protein [Microbacterium esteraromaticum]|uniref:hypothetical protein n=1 Tax=Microbacterium esteraromaticum TaxID=57043 RepID=UPI0021BDBF66|nr:hypothetical protein [Microbacterium esteraromaticum]